MRFIIFYLAFAIGAALSFFCLKDNPSLVAEIKPNLRFLPPICYSLMIGMMLFIKTSVKDLNKLEGLRSKELTIVNRFIRQCNNKVWSYIGLYAFNGLYAFIISSVSFPKPQYDTFLLTIFSGLLFLSLITVFSAFNLDRAITYFHSAMAIRAKKIKEKDDAMKLLDGDDSFSKADKEYFKKKRKVTKL